MSINSSDFSLTMSINSSDFSLTNLVSMVLFSIREFHAVPNTCRVGQRREPVLLKSVVIGLTRCNVYLTSKSSISTTELVASLLAVSTKCFDSKWTGIVLLQTQSTNSMGTNSMVGPCMCFDSMSVQEVPMVEDLHVCLAQSNIPPAFCSVEVQTDTLYTNTVF